MKKNKRYMKWKCNKCNDILISDNELRHKLDVCSCKGSFVDLEKEYCRIGGSVEVLEEYD